MTAVRSRRPSKAGRGEDLALLPLRRSTGSLILVAWGALILVAAVWWQSDPMALFFLAGCLACGIVSVPLAFGRTYDLLSPWSLILVGAYVGYGLRGLFISLGVDGTRTISELYLLGHGPGYFVQPSVIFLVGLIALTLGYLIAREGKSAPVAADREQRIMFNRSLLPLVIVGLALVGFAAFYMYADATGGLSLSRLSAKRSVISGLDLESSYRSHGQWRVLNTFSAIALWLQVADYAQRGVKHGILTGRGLWLVLLFVNACLLPFYASTRADVVFVLITAVVIEFCIGGKVNTRLLVGGTLVALALTVLLTTLRNADHGTLQADASVRSQVVDTFVLTRTFSDLPTSGHVIRAVPEVLPYANGDTIVSWLAAPVPRAIWPEKPIISLGPTIGILIYGNRNSGVPPGLVAESYWNYGMAGVLVLPMFCGWFIEWFYRRWARKARWNTFAAVVLSAVAVRTGFDIASNSIGFALFQLVQGLVLLVPVLLFVCQRVDEDAPVRP